MTRGASSRAPPAGPAAYLPARWPPLLYLGFAHACLATAFVLVAWDPARIAGFYYHPRLIAVGHLVTLGGVSSSILGALGALYLVGPLTFRITLPGSWRDSVAFAAWAIAVSGVAARLLPLYAWRWGFYDRGHEDSPPSPHVALARPAQMVPLGLWTAGVPGLAAGLALDRHAWIWASAGALAVALGGANLGLGIRRLWAREAGPIA